MRKMYVSFFILLFVSGLLQSADYSIDSVITKYSNFASQVYVGSDYKFQKLKKQFLDSLIGSSISLNVKIEVENISYSESENMTRYKYSIWGLYELENSRKYSPRIGLSNYLLPTKKGKYKRLNGEKSDYLFSEFVLNLEQTTDRLAMEVDSDDTINIMGVIKDINEKGISIKITTFRKSYESSVVNVNVQNEIKKYIYGKWRGSASGSTFEFIFSRDGLVRSLGNRGYIEGTFSADYNYSPIHLDLYFRGKPKWEVIIEFESENKMRFGTFHKSLNRPQSFQQQGAGTITLYKE